MVAQQVVLDAPELVRRILLAGTGPSGGEGMQDFTREVMDIVNRPNSTEVAPGVNLRNALHYQDGPIRTVAIGRSQKDFPNGEGHA
jgi:hypothetical protein